MPYKKANREQISAKSAYDRSRYAKRRAEFLSARKLYYQLNRDKVCAAERQRRLDNLERFKARAKIYVQEHRNEHNQRNKKWRKSLKGQNYYKQYYIENRSERRLYIRKYVNARRKSDSGFRILSTLRRRVYHFLIGRKSASTGKLLDCDLDWLKAWFEIQFKPGMSFANYGSVWHIDHKRPCTSFNLNDPQQQRLCFHWTNLQPLFAEENIAKGNKYEHI